MENRRSLVISPPVWVEPAPVDIPPSLVELAGHRLLAEILVRRGVSTVEDAARFLDARNAAPFDPHVLPGLDLAIARLTRARDRNEKVLVWGDFDADGQTSTALMVLALRRAGLSVTWTVPDRASESHGLNPRARSLANESGATLLVTCDCGVSDIDEIVALLTQNVDTIVTDHHSSPWLSNGFRHPAAAIVTPRHLPRSHPAAQLSGVGAAYCLASGFLNVLGLKSDDLLDLVALGTVADVVSLSGANRLLLQLGLPSLNAGIRPGIAALIRTAARAATGPADASIAGWVLAPRLNAFGRLSNAAAGVRLLLGELSEELSALADEANLLNTERQQVCEQIVEQARLRIESGSPLPADKIGPAGIVLADPTWHVGVIGLAASRLAELYLRPVALASLMNGSEARLSMRSPAWCDLTAILADVTDLAALNFRGGGHPGAAGGSMPSDRLAQFAFAFDVSAARQMPAELPHREIVLDGEIGLADLTLETCNALDRLAPFGAGNREPKLLLRDLLVTEARTIGSAQRHRMLRLSDGRGQRARAVWWDGARHPIPRGPIDLCAAVEKNSYNGQIEIRLSIEAIRSSTSHRLNES